MSFNRRSMTILAIVVSLALMTASCQDEPKHLHLAGKAVLKVGDQEKYDLLHGGGASGTLFENATLKENKEPEVAEVTIERDSFEKQQFFVKIKALKKGTTDFTIEARTNRASNLSRRFQIIVTDVTVKVPLHIHYVRATKQVGNQTNEVGTKSKNAVGAFDTAIQKKLDEIWKQAEIAFIVTSQSTSITNDDPDRFIDSLVTVAGDLWDGDNSAKWEALMKKNNKKDHLNAYLVNGVRSTEGKAMTFWDGDKASTHPGGIETTEVHGIAFGDDLASGDDVRLDVLAHEIGHAFGLRHYDDKLRKKIMDRDLVNLFGSNLMTSPLTTEDHRVTDGQAGHARAVVAAKKELAK